ncbi:DUF2442 domain-containing protein [Parerythrobacter jejuensis]|uniref:DUF2442 domain-containing protein n=1 Tax=Parerythrobacter jejuensis TaxID=795812 RepID=A0A845AN63_9SPHN|nr:DUF2442 domain-containing protein [Parerythrobacter jejuensis]MXP30335.1 DUF2442 domain-containing protein [Parerythrobacter jejuensis]MXP33095.1 DUF2442 domain-containing protein [Parerythrobacter jejuensis]
MRDERVVNVQCTDVNLRVELADGRTITAPLSWYPRLFDGSAIKRKNWTISGSGYGIHWPDLDEDISVEGLLKGSAAP